LAPCGGGGGRSVQEEYQALIRESTQNRREFDRSGKRARMEQLATPGSILLTATTLRPVEGLVRVNSLGPVPVKGRAEPVEVFELAGVTPSAAACRRLQRVG